jgi:protein-tyrosine kinase
MSEIFDFLKKTGAEGKQKPSIPAPAVEASSSEFKTTAVAGSEATPKDAKQSFAEPAVRSSDKIDLNGASQSIKRVLDPFTTVGEQFRYLRSRLDILRKQRDIKVVLITSSIPEEGKTLVATGLAGVFAQEPGKRVLLIDADMRKPRPRLNLGLNGSNPGLSGVLAGTIGFESALLASDNPEFWFLPSGPLPSNPTELLSSTALERILKTSVQMFDWVIIDSPPVLSLSDATLLAGMSDTVLLILRANSTPAKLVEDTISRVGRDRICGVVINRQTQAHASRYYYQYYYRKSGAPD